MSAARKPDAAREFFRTDKREMLKLMEKIDAEAGIIGPPTMTIDELHASQRVSGIRPEDNIGSRELMRMRYGDDWQEDED